MSASERLLRCPRNAPPRRRSRLGWAVASAVLAVSALHAPTAGAAPVDGHRSAHIAEPITTLRPAPEFPDEPKTLNEPDPVPVRPPNAGDAVMLPTFTGPEFNQLFNTANLPNLASIGSVLAITDSEEMDQQIREHAEQRGYQLRPLPVNYALMRFVAEGQVLQRPAASAWLALRADAAANGIEIELKSAYRGQTYQRTVFLRTLSEPYEYEEMVERLKMSAPPGYSKHHTGYAIDVAQDGYLHFGQSPAYDWLATDNFANAKKHGWIPSYPPDGGLQGPVPEPWEFTYVGRFAILCFHQRPPAGDPLCRN
ncbi:M15 family metallopeptidase [Candidatus Poriferisodalis sp.]|uniref:M15 family metallopeptidase n=1 Tax=Candidatus Poriferisodalis sp. TaxID=3101277 RepID=UPI003B02A855